MKRTPMKRSTPLRRSEPEAGIVVPIRTVNGMNVREHWRARHRRVSNERGATTWVLRGQPKPALPCTVLMTRLAPSNGLDDDNLAGALKSVRDAIAEWLGVDDRRAEVVRYRCAQERGAWGVRIEFQPAEVKV